MYLHSFFLFFFIDPAPTEIYTLSLHDALPICACRGDRRATDQLAARHRIARLDARHRRDDRAARCHRCEKAAGRSEEHTSELQSRLHLVCRLLLEKKKKKKKKKNKVLTH